jgi:Mrp family chromosome partitioning ATPase
LLTSINRIDLKHKDLQSYLPQTGTEPVNESQKLFLENLRKLRFELENSGKKIILVTSTRPKEGKSLIIESLANSFSLSHKKVLIIDANFSNNTLSEKFGAKPSLEQFSVNGQPNAMDKILSAMGATTIPNTDIIGCNEGNYTPSEILPKNHLLESIDKIAASYDIILIESASLNNHADAKELAKYVDGIVAVFSANSAIAQSDKESIEYLKSTGTKLVGAVFNNVQKDNMDL